MDDQTLNQQATSAVSVSKLPNVLDLLKESLAIYKKRFKTFLAIAIIPVLSYVLLGLVLFGFILLPKESNATANIIMIILGFLGILIILFMIFVSIWSNLALIQAIKDRDRGMGFKEAFKTSLPKILSSIGISILLILIVLGGTVLLIIPGIIFAIWFGFAIYVFIAEDLKGFAALKRSKEYVRGKWWQVFGRYLAFISLCLLLGLAIGLILGILYSVIGEVKILTSIINYAFQLLIAPLSFIYYFILYEKLRAIKLGNK